jgi:hypothetical protein
MPVDGHRFQYESFACRPILPRINLLSCYTALVWKSARLAFFYCDKCRDLVDGDTDSYLLLCNPILGTYHVCIGCALALDRFIDRIDKRIESRGRTMTSMSIVDRMKDKQRSITLRLPQDIIEEIARAMNETGCTFAEIAQEELREYMRLPEEERERCSLLS